MSGRAIQRGVRQSPRKMRLVIDLIRGKDVNEAYAILKFNKKLAAKQIAKTLKSAVANAEQKALKFFNLRAKNVEDLKWDGSVVGLPSRSMIQPGGTGVPRATDSAILPAAAAEVAMSR